jgi:ABC-type multidrug transport system ATPase subunit
MRICDLVVVYGTGVRVGPVSWSLAPGVHRLTGPNGSGKTTLMRAMAADLHPSGGTVEVAGRDLHRDAGARRHVGYLPATPDLPGYLTVDESWQTVAALRGDPDWDGAPVREALALPGDLRVSHGSSGQRRRAALLAALAADPDVLLLDEPFAHLDDQGCAFLAGWIDDARDRRVVVLTHHGTCPVVVDRELSVNDR